MSIESLDFCLYMIQSCLHCSAQFEITEEDLQFLEMLSPVIREHKYTLPPPQKCSLCRMQQRLSYRNERFLYHRKCDLSGKQIISSYSEEKAFPVCDIEEWWSDKWSGLSYGRVFDFTRAFFEQFFELRNRVPRMALQQQKPMENSHYCNCVSRNKNCYLVFSTNECEDCYYGSWVNQSKNCIDNLVVEDCELCYDCTACRGCYELLYSRDCNNCNSSYFLRHCTGCTNCFACSNQVNKQYMLFNTYVGKEKYEQFFQSLNVGSFKTIQLLKERVDQELNDMIVKEFNGINLENCTGDYLRNCKNVQNSFECHNCEDLRHVQCVQNTKNCMDYSHWGQNAEMIYNSQACGYDLQNLICSNLCWSGCHNLLYCDHMFSSHHCFGCVGLKKKSYCIFNKQYRKEEYEKIVPQIIVHMQKTGEWGEFFPANQSVYAYNETLAQEQIPLTRQEALLQGFLWHDQDVEQKSYLGPKYEIPDTITQVGNEICTYILHCQKTAKPYKIIPQELQFYRQMNIPIPRLCPNERHQKRFDVRTPRRLWQRKCQKCQKEIQTTYSPDRPETVYCEACYLETVY